MLVEEIVGSVEVEEVTGDDASISYVEREMDRDSLAWDRDYHLFRSFLQKTLACYYCTFALKRHTQNFYNRYTVGSYRSFASTNVPLHASELVERIGSLRKCYKPYFAHT